MKRQFMKKKCRGQKQREREKMLQNKTTLDKNNLNCSLLARVWKKFSTPLLGLKIEW